MLEHVYKNQPIKDGFHKILDCCSSSLGFSSAVATMSSRSQRTCSMAPKTTNSHHQPCHGVIQRWDNVVGVVDVVGAVVVVGVGNDHDHFVKELYKGGKKQCVSRSYTKVMMTGMTLAVFMEMMICIVKERVKLTACAGAGSNDSWQGHRLRGGDGRTSSEQVRQLTLQSEQKN